MYKSDRTFKDYEDKTDILDPRFAYLKTCKDMKILPKARMVIKKDVEDENKYLSFANFRLSGESVKAVTESLKRYPIEVEAIDFTNNTLKPRETELIIESMSKHYESIRILSLANNRIGVKGARAVGQMIPQLKSIINLDVSQNNMGDFAFQEIISGVIQVQDFEKLNFSNNCIGQTQNLDAMTSFKEYLKNTHKLVELNMSWNNLRGQVAEVLIDGISHNISLTTCNLSYNLLGIGVKGELTTREPAAMKLSEALSENQTMKELDLSSNLIDTKAALCIALGVKANSSLTTLKVDSNPIGSAGI